MNIRKGNVETVCYGDIKPGQVFCDCNGYFDKDEIHIISDLFYVKTSFNHSSVSLNSGDIDSFMPDEKVVLVESFRIKEYCDDNCSKEEDVEGSLFRFKDSIMIRSSVPYETDGRFLYVNIHNGSYEWLYDNDDNLKRIVAEGIF